MYMSEQEQIDLCDSRSFTRILEANPEMIFLVTKQGCSLCPSLREAADKVGDRKQIPVLEMEIKKDGDGPCQLLDEDLKMGSDVGVAVVFKARKEVGRRKSTGFLSHDVANLEKLLI
jgi:hypothetical protein